MAAGGAAPPGSHLRALRRAVRAMAAEVVTVLTRAPSLYLPPEPGGSPPTEPLRNAVRPPGARTHILRAGDGREGDGRHRVRASDLVSLLARKHRLLPGLKDPRSRVSRRRYARSISRPAGVIGDRGTLMTRKRESICFASGRWVGQRSVVSARSSVRSYRKACHTRLSFPTHLTRAGWVSMVLLEWNGCGGRATTRREGRTRTACAGSPPPRPTAAGAPGC